MNNISLTEDTLFVESLNQMRHLGNLRFAILGVYSALVVGFLAITYTIPSQSLLGLHIFGVLVALVFSFFEFTLSHQHARLARWAKDIEGKNGPIFNGRIVKTFGPVTCLTLLLYVSSIAIWFGA